MTRPRKNPSAGWGKRREIHFHLFSDILCLMLRFDIVPINLHGKGRECVDVCMLVCLPLCLSECCSVDLRDVEKGSLFVGCLLNVPATG